jgi:hypothetical protein
MSLPPLEERMYDCINVPLGRGAKFGTIEVDRARFSEVVNEHIYMYGLRQILNDACAQKKDENGAELSPDEITAKAHARLRNLYDGVLRTRNDEIGDPRERIVFNLTRDALISKWRAAGTFGNFPKNTKNRFLFCANKIQREAGRDEFASDQDYVSAQLNAAPKMRAKFEKQADEILAGNDDLGIAV